jgi:hypothetical protein
MGDISHLKPTHCHCQSGSDSHLDVKRFNRRGEDCTSFDLDLYNIKLTRQTSDNFFGCPLPTVESLTDIDTNLMSGTPKEDLSDETYRLLLDFCLASTANRSHHVALHDFARGVLKV